ncbi:hypothetical protein K1719_008046 [Acacia pycnantha]|nr:hypothetical protein K1719_008046 [Acacia pycnantha]
MENLGDMDIEERPCAGTERVLAENWVIPMAEKVLWNSRGAASKGFAAVVKDMRVRHKLDLVVILEPRVSELGWMVWRCQFSAVYASPCEQKRHSLWNTFQELESNVSEPWLIAGDFNEIKTPLEQKGGGRVSEARCRKFNDWIQGCGLIDIDAKGPFYTWKGPKWQGLDRVFKRLDRCLCNIQWIEKFENAEVRVSARVGSDHHPLLIKLDAKIQSYQKRNFRYEAMWQMHENFEEVMRKGWRGSDEAHVKLVNLQQDLTKWNADVFGHVAARELWLELWEGRVAPDFLNKQGRDWFGWNLNFHQKEWRLTFGVTCWLLWSWRNKSCFQGGFEMPMNKRFIVAWHVNEIKRARCDFGKVCRTRQDVEIKWLAPLEGSIEQEEQLVIFDNPPPIVRNLLYRYSVGVSYPRYVLINE